MILVDLSRKDLVLLASIEARIVAAINKKGDEVMALIDSIRTAQQVEHGDVVLLAGLVAQLLQAFASGAISPAQAQSLVDASNDNDATLKTLITSIQGAVAPPTPPTPVAP